MTKTSISTQLRYWHKQVAVIFLLRPSAGVGSLLWGIFGVVFFGQELADRLRVSWATGISK